MEKTRTETITNRSKHEKTAHIDAIKEDLEPHDVFYVHSDNVGLPYQQTRFMTGNDIRDIGDRRVQDVYTNGYYVPRK